MSSLSSSQQQKLSQLIEFTRLSENDARRLLMISNWDINTAIDNFYQNPRIKHEPQRTDFNPRLAQKMFDKYQDPEKRDKITVEGCMLLCEDLGIEPTALEFLLISHQLNSKMMGEFTRQEFVEGCTKLQCDTPQKLKNIIPSLRNNLSDDASFREIYSYAFVFGRQFQQKSLSLEAAVELWRLLLTGRFSMLDQWIQFLEEKHGKAISRDTWNLFFEFASQKDLDLSKHDAEGAWPILIDEV
ncbi:Cullin binding-domain-containing protein [Phycomyces blakesleeanus]